MIIVPFLYWSPRLVSEFLSPGTGSDFMIPWMFLICHGIVIIQCGKTTFFDRIVLKHFSFACLTFHNSIGSDGYLYIVRRGSKTDFIFSLLSSAFTNIMIFIMTITEESVGHCLGVIGFEYHPFLLCFGCFGSFCVQSSRQKRKTLTNDARPPFFTVVRRLCPCSKGRPRGETLTPEVQHLIQTDYRMCQEAEWRVGVITWI